ncbi:MAG: hypothetical protein SFV81_08070 [Pirellulaceae bacterium]|nr:hypothetical protein [Pirellulaceae bacterium]
MQMLLHIGRDGNRNVQKNLHNALGGSLTRDTVRPASSARGDVGIAT